MSFTPAEVKDIAAKALAEYKKLSLVNHLKNPGKALRTAFEQPQLIFKYIKKPRLLAASGFRSKGLFSKHFFTKTFFQHTSVSGIAGITMGEFEEETYSTVFTALKHPIRRKILRTLYENARSFTDMQNMYNVNGAVLTYHLEAMKDLVSKTDEGKYKLSDMGEGAIALMERVEEPPKAPTASSSPKKKRRLLIVQAALVFAAIILLVSGSYLASMTSVRVYYDLPLSVVFSERSQLSLAQTLMTRR